MGCSYRTQYACLKTKEKRKQHDSPDGWDDIRLLLLKTFECKFKCLHMNLALV